LFNFIQQHFHTNDRQFYDLALRTNLPFLQHLSSTGTKLFDDKFHTLPSSTAVLWQQSWQSKINIFELNEGQFAEIA